MILGSYYSEMHTLPSKSKMTDRMSVVFDIVPSAAWGFSDFLGSLLLPQQVAAILRCDAIIPSFQKGHLQQTCTPSRWQDPKTPTIWQYQLSIFPHDKVKALSVEPTQTHTFFFLMELRRKRKKLVKNLTLLPLFKVNSESGMRANVY